MVKLLNKPELKGHRRRLNLLTQIFLDRVAWQIIVGDYLRGKDKKLIGI